jgi:Ras-related protein Rab-11A
VSSEGAIQYAEKEGMSFLETSALDATNVSTAFELIVKGKF